MKTEIIEAGNKSGKYPQLMMMNEDKMVVLFSEPKVGVVVFSRSGWKPGHFSTSWTMECFTDFKGKLVLSND